MIGEENELLSSKPLARKPRDDIVRFESQAKEKWHIKNFVTLQKKKKIAL